MPSSPLLLHVFSTFGTGGPQLRTIQIINHLGAAFRHAIVAMDGEYGARYGIGAGVDCQLIPPPSGSGPLLQPLRMSALVSRVRPNLALTYNWGAMDGVVGALLARKCPVIHTEDGFGPDEAVSLKTRRVLARRVLLPWAHKTIVPSRVLLDIARNQYRLPEDKILYIANGIDLRRYRPGQDRGCRAELCRGASPECTVLFGSVGQLRPEKNLSLMLRAFAGARIPDARLVLVGDGVCRGELERLSASLGLGEQVVFAGAAQDPVPFYRAFDVFVMSSNTEQMPISLLEAMASGLPALCTDVGDSAAMLGASAPPEIIPPGNLEAFAGALAALAAEPALRASIGRKNRRRCEENHDAGFMMQRYAMVYRSAIKGSE